MRLLPIPATQLLILATWLGFVATGWMIDHYGWSMSAMRPVTVPS